MTTRVFVRTLVVMANVRGKTFRQRLKAARGCVGLSASRLSILAGLVRTHVTTFENDPNRGIDLETAVRLSTVLGVPLEWLAQGKGPDPKADDIKAAIERREKSPMPPRGGRGGVDRLSATGTDG